MTERQRILELVKQGVVTTNEGLDLLESLPKEKKQRKQSKPKSQDVETSENQNDNKQESANYESDGKQTIFQKLFKLANNVIKSLIKMFENGKIFSLFKIIKNIIKLLLKMIVNIIKEAIQMLLQTLKEIKDKIKMKFDNLMTLAQEMDEEDILSNIKQSTN